MALRPQSLTWLSTNRAIAELHTYMTVLFLPLGLAHVIAIVLDPYARVGLGDLLVPFRVSYGAVAIGVGTISLQLLVVVLLAAWSQAPLARPVARLPPALLPGVRGGVPPRHPVGHRPRVPVARRSGVARSGCPRPGGPAARP
ncbi:MAG TPA: hypothetical protein VGK15_07895 [Candidatus Limnocylindria bacterium]